MVIAAVSRIGEGGECFPRYNRKRIRKCYKTLDYIQSSRQCRTPPGTPHIQHLLTGPHPPVLGCWCFCFDSSPGPGQSPSVTHTYWLLTDFGPFSCSTFFLFNEFPFVFPETVSIRTKTQWECLKVSWTCSRSAASCIRVSRETLSRVCMCIVWNRNPQTIQSFAFGI